MMKIRNIPLTMGAPWCVHSFKCNPLAMAAAVSGGTNIAGSIIGGLFGYKTAKANNRANLQIARETNEMNYKIAQEANQMQQQNLWDNMAWQERMTNQQNDFNSIGSQMARASAAGINPYSLLDSGAGTAQSANVPSSPSSGFTPAVAQMQAAHLENAGASFANMFSSIGNTLANLVQSGVSVEKLEPELELLRTQTKEMVANVKNKELQNEMLQMLNLIQSKHGERRYLAETRKFLEDANAAAASANASDASALLSKAQAEYTAAKTETEKQIRQYQVNIAKQTVELVKAQTSESRASAGLKRAEGSYYGKLEERLEQPIDGIVLNDKEKKDIKDIILDMKNMDYNEMVKRYNKFLEEHGWSRDKLNTILRYLKTTVDDSPVVGNVTGFFNGLK